MTNLWKSGTQKAFYGYMANLAISVIGGLILWMLEPSVLEVLAGGGSGYFTALIIFGLAGVAALVYYIMGLNEMKKAAANTSLEDATQRLFIGAALTIGSLVLSSFNTTLLFGALLGLAGFIVTWTGYSMVKDSATDANAKFGGEKLAFSALIVAIAYVVDLVPVIGDLAALCLEAWAAYIAYQGWKALTESEL